MAIWEVRTRSGAVEVEGGNWLLAVGVALPALGMQPDVLARLVCDVQPDGIVRIVDPVSRTPFLVRRLKEELRSDGARIVNPIGVVAAGGPLVAQAPGEEEAAEPEVDDEEPLDEEVDITSPPVELDMPSPSAPSFQEDTRTFDPELLDAPDPQLPPPAPPLPPPPPAAAEAHHPYAPAVPHPEPAHFTEEHLRTLDDLEPLIGGGDADTTSPPDDLEELLFMRGMDVADADSPRQAAERALEILGELIPAEAASVLYAGINDTALHFLAASGPTADRLHGIEVPLGTGIAGFCFDNGSSLIIRNAEQDPRHLHAVDRATGYHTRDLLTVAVRDRGGRIHGCVQLLNPRTGRFDPWHLEAAAAVAGTLGDYFLARG